MRSSSQARASGVPSPDWLPQPDLRRRFRRRLLSWYRKNGRDLPWRHTRDPYLILVSEVMLQQTQVDRVIPKYKEWLQKYPSFEVLAAARLSEVNRTWRPLGYNARPGRLHAIAQEVIDRCGGRLPSGEKALRSFKGIGAYTAGAIQSFAFGKRAAIVDTNVARVLSRVFLGQETSIDRAFRKQLWLLSETLLPRRNVFDFNQAFMDLGAMVCVARRPHCPVCPMSPLCKTYFFNKDLGERKQRNRSRP